MSQLHLSDEILMAFADGELEEPTAAAVARAMADDATVAKRIMDFQQSRRLSRSAFSMALTPDVTPELRAAVLAQVKSYEAAGESKAPSDIKPLQNEWFRRKRPFMQMALAASVAAIALALGYFMGWQGRPGPDGLIAQLESPLIRHELNSSASGKDVELPFGRMRVISTYRLPNGSLCREFRLQSSTESAEAVACRNGEWNATFAMASAVNNAEYTPSGGGDPVVAYLQSIGAVQPLVDEAEARALAETAR
jgi:hypothetical protein